MLILTVSAFKTFSEGSWPLFLIRLYKAKPRLLIIKIKAKITMLLIIMVRCLCRVNRIFCGNLINNANLMTGCISLCLTIGSSLIFCPH